MANPSDVSWRSLPESWIQMDACLMPTLVITYLPSGVGAVPSSSVAPEVICSGVPSGNFCRQMWKLPDAVEEKYIHWPSGDHAAVVHCPSFGPARLPGDEPSKGTRRHGSHADPSISATSNHLRSGDNADRWAHKCRDVLHGFRRNSRLPCGYHV